MATRLSSVGRPDRTNRRIGLQGTDRFARVGRHLRMGIRPRWSWSRRSREARPASATPMPIRRRPGSASDMLAGVVKGRDAMGVPGAWSAMVAAIRNLGRPGIASMAISAVDTALWDLKARLLDVPLVTLLGAVRDAAPVYGSGGFTSYSDRQLRDQLSGWVEAGIPRVKMKIGRNPAEDIGRVRAARAAIGPDAELFVDANGAYSRKQAMAMAEVFAESDVTWFEEPVSSDDLEGLRLMRDRAPSGMEIAAGEYGYDLFYFSRMLEAGAVRRPASRRDALRRDHRIPPCRRTLRSPWPALLGPLRTVAPRPPQLRPAGLPPPGVFPRPRTDRTPILRRRADSGRRGAPSRPGPPRPGPRIQASGRRTLRHLITRPTRRGSCP